MGLEIGASIEAHTGRRRTGSHSEAQRKGVELQSPDELRRENQILRDRISRLSAASLRISASLDLDTVLSEVVESSRALTGARYGGSVTIGESGRTQDYPTLNPPT